MISKTYNFIYFNLFYIQGKNLLLNIIYKLIEIKRNIDSYFNKIKNILIIVKCLLCKGVVINNASIKIKR